jgi:hypothetical protein
MLASKLFLHFTINSLDIQITVIFLPGTFFVFFSAVEILVCHMLQFNLGGEEQNE